MKPWFGDIRRSSLVSRLVLLAAGWSVALLVVAGFGLTAFYRQAAVTRFEAGLNEVINGLAAETTVDVEQGGQVFAPAMTDARAFRPYSGYYWQIAELDGKGGVRALSKSRSLWDSALNIPPLAVEKMQKQAGRTAYFDAVDPLGRPIHVGAQLARLPGRTEPVVFMAAENRSSIDSDSSRFGVTIVIALILVGAGLVAVVLVQVRVGLQPVFKLRRELANVRTGKIERLEGEYPIELAPLAGELNALVSHNQDVVERQRTHVGNLAHALKTPLSVMLTEARQQPGPLSSVVEHQAEVMREQVDHHLRRARAAARSQTLGERTPVAPVLDELAVTLERIFQDKNLEIDWRCPDDLCFQGERQDLLEIVGNLMENGGKFGRRRVKVAAAPLTDSTFSMTIEDDGAGLPADRRGEVLKRGARLDENAPGSGLGLNIVDELARAYGGSLELGKSEMGGLKVSLVLPRIRDLKAAFGKP